MPSSGLISLSCSRKAGTTLAVKSDRVSLMLSVVSLSSTACSHNATCPGAAAQSFPRRTWRSGACLRGPIGRFEELALSSAAASGSAGRRPCIFRQWLARRGSPWLLAELVDHGLDVQVAGPILRPLPCPIGGMTQQRAELQQPDIAQVQVLRAQEWLQDVFQPLGRQSERL